MKQHSVYVDQFWLKGRFWSFAQWNHPGQQRITFTDEVIDWVGRYVKEGDDVLDIGAYTGDTAFPFLVQGCRVLGLEPNPATFRVLRANASFWSTLDIMNCAVMPTAGKYVFDYSDDDFGNGGLGPIPHHHSKLEVNAIAPSDIPDRKWKFIKIDVETQDIKLVGALSDIIRAHKPVVQLEIHFAVPKQERLDFVNTISELGYQSEHKDLPCLMVSTIATKTTWDLVLTPK